MSVWVRMVVGIVCGALMLAFLVLWGTGQVDDCCGLAERRRGTNDNWMAWEEAK